MSLIIATGSNLGDRRNNLKSAKERLSELFTLKAQSRIYRSPAVGKTNQPDFLNQMLEFDLPHNRPESVMVKILEIECELGRERVEKWGPRVIDIDIIFWAMKEVNTANLTIPHPYWNERMFVVWPLKELPYFSTVKKKYIVSEVFDHEAYPVET